MTTYKKQSRVVGEKHALLANVALLYYGEGMTQHDIAKRLNVARSTVVNFLREARELGIVDIRVDGNSLSSSNLAAQLKDAFGLEDVYIARKLANSGDGAEEESLRQLGRIGATAMRDLLKPGDKLGIAWGVPVQTIGDHLTYNPIEDVRVYQMIGSINTDLIPASEKCTVDIATKLGAQCFTLHAPALASTPDIADILTAEPTIAAQMDALRHLDLVVASIGSVADTTPMAVAKMLTLKELGAARRAGAAGILCCRFINADGERMEASPNDRVIAAEPEAIRRAKRRLLIVDGEDRLDATLAAIRGGYVTHLCVGETLASMLVAKGATKSSAAQSGSEQPEPPGDSMARLSGRPERKRKQTAH